MNFDYSTYEEIHFFSIRKNLTYTQYPNLINAYQGGGELFIEFKKGGQYNWQPNKNSYFRNTLREVKLYDSSGRELNRDFNKNGWNSFVSIDGGSENLYAIESLGYKIKDPNGREEVVAFDKDCSDFNCLLPFLRLFLFLSKFDSWESCLEKFGSIKKIKDFAMEKGNAITALNNLSIKIATETFSISDLEKIQNIQKAIQGF